MQWPVLESARERSKQGLAKLRELAASAPQIPGLIIGANGSYARREATTGSDLDLFFLYEGKEAPVLAAKERLSVSIRSQGFKPPSAGGVFEKPLRISELTENIGGAFDTNETITRRMLLLLEGEWISNEEAFHAARDQILRAYVPSDTRPDHICLFLLNDVIRYWRTMCVDYQHKITKDKPKAIRLIKLRFSRMLLYFGGIIATAETWNLDVDAKRAKLLELLTLPTTSRVESVFGEGSRLALDAYATFLNALDDHATRTLLENPELDLSNSEAFQVLRGRAQEFRRSLSQLLTTRYEERHPIHMALLF